MAATTSFFFNSYSLRPSKKHASCWGLDVKDLMKVNATRGSIYLKPKMMLDQNNDYPNLVSNIGLGRMVDSFVFRQTSYIRSYEVGADRTLSMETLVNHLQETTINHLKEIGVLGDGLGLTKEMCKKKLIWVMAKLQVTVDRYPVWGDVVQIDTWSGAYGKIGMSSNWIFRDYKSGEILIRASCVWLMMNKETRKLSKFPNEVREELEQFWTDKPLPIKEDTRKWSKQDDDVVDHVRNGLTPKWSDLDTNQHVNNVKYIGWILESVPYAIVEKYELVSMTLEYHQECGMDNVLQSHTFVTGTNNVDDHVDCEHVLQFEIGSGGREIMKGRTKWRSKHEIR